MKKAYSPIVVLLLLFITAYGAVPEAIKYQAIARDNNGNILANKNIGIRMTILKGNVSGVSVYTERHNVISNTLGIINLEIGKGTPVSGAMSDINWGDDNYFIKIEMDDNGGTGYNLVGTSQLVSVPYSLYAKTAGNGTQWIDTSSSIYYSSGKVGVGTDNPKASFEVKKSERTGNNILITGETPTIKITDTSYTGNGVVMGVAADSNDLIPGSGRGDVVITNEAYGSGGAYIIGTGVPSQTCVKVTEDCMVGIGTDKPVSKLDVKGGDINIEDIGSGVIMKSPDGNCWRLTVSNAGQPVFTSIACLTSASVADSSGCMNAVACYPFNGNANDVSGHNFNGTVHNATLSKGHKGETNSSYYFRGYNSGNPDWIDLPTLQTMDNTDEFSISMWLKADSTVATGQNAICLFPDDASDRLSFVINWTPSTYYWDYGDIFGSGRIFTSAANSYAWDHFVCVKSASGGYMKLYKNNVLISSSAVFDNIADKNRILRLGGGINSGTQYFGGWIDDVKIFDRALTPDEVSNIYNKEK